MLFNEMYLQNDAEYAGREVIGEDSENNIYSSIFSWLLGC